MIFCMKKHIKDNILYTIYRYMSYIMLCYIIPYYIMRGLEAKGVPGVCGGVRAVEFVDVEIEILRESGLEVLCTSKRNLNIYGLRGLPAGSASCETPQCTASLLSSLRMQRLDPLVDCRRLLLGGSWVVISRVISPLIWVISIVTLLITPLMTTQELPSRTLGAPERILK